MPRQTKKGFKARFQLEKGVDRSICYSRKFARHKIQELGQEKPNKTITVIVNGTTVKQPFTFSFMGKEWKANLDLIPLG